MKRKDELAKLIAKVEAGGIVQPFLFQDVFNNQDAHENCSGEAYSAYKGSLDAAISWLAVVLPGWEVGQIGQSVADGSGVWSVWIVAPDYLESRIQSHASDPGLARALLLAGLRALHAQEKA